MCVCVCARACKRELGRSPSSRSRPLLHLPHPPALLTLPAILRSLSVSSLSLFEMSDSLGRRGDSIRRASSSAQLKPSNHYREERVGKAWKEGQKQGGG
jgi:hypothetical protein